MRNVYTDSKVFHFPQKLADIQAGRLSAPIHVRLKPTNKCAHRCSYCCYRNEELYLSERVDPRDEIPREKMQEIVSDLGQMGVRAVTFSGGGEPLSYPHILEALEGLLEAGIKVATLTHGGLLKGKVAKLLGDRATWVRVSMDAADRDTYAKIRDIRPQEFDTVCQNIRRFARAKQDACELGLNFIVTHQNAGDVGAFLAMAKDLGADHTKVSCAVVATTPEGNAEYMAPFYDSVKRQIAEAQGALQDDSYRIIDKVHRPDEQAESFERSYTWCPFIQCLTVIAADQNVYTCHDKAYTTSGLLGSIRDQSFRQLWNSEAVRRRMRSLDPSRECRHHCVHNALNLTLLDFFEADQDHLDFV